VLALIFAGPCIYLIGFHVYLRVKKLTTYEYVIKGRERDRRVTPATEATPGNDEADEAYELSMPKPSEQNSEMMELSQRPTDRGRPGLANS
jgi:hypothetical protein